jgi:glutamate--glyoxylate aminotransferase
VCVQAGLALMVNPPKAGDESYEQHQEETAAILASLRRRAQIMTDGFNACEGVTCNFTEGAMYSFPKLHLPPKVGQLVQHGHEPDNGEALPRQALQQQYTRTCARAQSQG